MYLGKRYEASDSQKGVKIQILQKYQKHMDLIIQKLKKNNEIEKTLKKVLKSNKPEFINVYLKS